MPHHPEERILQSWHQNADCWTEAVRSRQIESRRLVTDAAIEQAVLRCHPQTVLDLGCGEGWLTRTLTHHDIDVLGVDAIPALIQQAQSLGLGNYQQLDYDTLSQNLLNRRFDVVVCNFSLFGKASVERLVQCLPSLMNPQGYLIVQTLHPETACGDAEYKDGWREGAWVGFSSKFVNPAPWYFRTTASWLTLLDHSGFHLHEMQAPQHPVTRIPVSLLLIASVRSA